MREIVHRQTIIQTEFEIVEDGPNGKYVAEVKRGQEEVRKFTRDEFTRVFDLFDQSRQDLENPAPPEEPSPNGKPARKPRGKSRQHAPEETEKTHALN